ncbi:AAA family ATPase [Agromyces bracchium]|uniref:AAA family ATPase n=1 Tax=Agromyces bracchium TaxID=88376 RepID=A0A6I3MC80_9MICO|nr:AAA family ATPase [Agromyces bracchium]MTH70368.1 AAA family ATPase [Agromyces bracchium]
MPGEYLTFGVESAMRRLASAPRVALLGPLLSFEETKRLSEKLAARWPGIGVIVVREQRSDLEDWVDGMEIHAVLSPEASDATTEALLARLDDWLVSSGRLQPVTEAEEAVEAEQDDIAGVFALLGPEMRRADFEPSTPYASTSSGIADLDTAHGVGAIDVESELVSAPELEPESEPAEAEWVLPPMAENVRSEVIVVAAPKGGQGKTTTAINLAAGLAEVEPNSVVLVDADVQFGDIANALDLHPQYSLADVVRTGTDEVELKALLTHHDDDFFVIAAPPSPELADGIATGALGALLDRLATMFRYVIVDTTPGLPDHTLTALEHATDGVFVSNMTVPSLRALRKEFELLLALNLVPNNRHVVVNFVEKNTGLVAKDVAAIIGTPIDVLVPRSTAVVLASNEGAPLIHHDVRDAAAKAFRTVVQRIDPSAVPTRRRIHRKARTK